MDTNKMNDGLNFLLCEQRMALIHGVIKRLGVSPSRSYYPDLVQEGCLAFAEAYANYDHPIDDEPVFMRHAYQKIRWRLLDYLRHQQRAVQCTDYSLNDDRQTSEQADLVDTTALSPFEQVDNQGLIKKLNSYCSPAARKYLYAVLSGRWKNDQEIANYHGVSRQAVNQWKKALTKTAREFLAKDDHMV